MNPSDPIPKLPAWLFVLFNVAAVIVAAFIVGLAPRPLSPLAILSTVGCVAIGALAGLVPLVAYFERQKNAALDERQSALEALARTVASSADQISIAAGALHDLADLAQKNLRHAEQLPHKLQEKVAEFQAQLSQAADADREELERELLALRTTESERLESVSQRIAKSSAEWSKLEAATQQHLAAANDAIARLAFSTADAIGKAQAAAEQALAQARSEAARDIGQAAGAATKTVEAAKSSALAELETTLAAAGKQAAATLVSELNARLGPVIASLNETLAGRETTVATSRPPTLPPTDRPPDVHAPTAEATEATASAVSAPPEPSSPIGTETPPDSAAAPSAISAPVAKRPRKPRRDEPAGDVPVLPAAPAPDSLRPPESTGVEPATAALAAAPVELTPGAPATPAAPAAAAENPEPAASVPSLESPTPVVSHEPAPVPAANIGEITPAAPAATNTAESFPIDPHSRPNGTSVPTPPTSEEPETEKPARKRIAKKAGPEPDDNPSLDLGLDDMGAASSVGIAERVLTSDGATRLLVTAYIGIGNRLFIRGEGPGLSWEKGVPLQFVSIGKWRWETSDASAPVQFKLYKNDTVECAALGAQILDPAYQQEVTATF